MKINITDTHVCFGDLKGGEVFRYGDYQICLALDASYYDDYGRDGQENDAVSLVTGKPLLIMEAELVEIFPNATLNL